MEMVGANVLVPTERLAISGWRKRITFLRQRQNLNKSMLSGIAWHPFALGRSSIALGAQGNLPIYKPDEDSQPDVYEVECEDAEMAEEVDPADAALGDGEASDS
eukprot:1264486-Pyramimonas_sp.AAC.1